MTAYLLPAALLLLALLVFLSVRALRIRGYARRRRNHPARNPETLHTIAAKSFPGVSLPRVSSNRKKGGNDGTWQSSWQWWLEQHQLSALRLATEADGQCWSGSTALNKIHQIDRRVFASIAELTRRRVNAFTDLDRPFQWMARQEETDTRVDRHDREYAERIVASQLGWGGYDVIFPEEKLRRGYRLVVDGKSFLFGEEFRFDYARHFISYPGIGMITPDDFFNVEEAMLTLDTAPKAHRLTPLTGTGIDPVDLANRAFSAEAVAGPADAFTVASAGGLDYHNPVVTLGLSSLREIRLLRKKHTNLLTAAKNIGLDAAGTGVGGYAGAKAGATFGTAVSPGVGTIVGALIGGMSGAYAGRRITNRIKFAKAEAARKNYEEKAIEFQKRVMEVTIAARKLLESAITIEQEALRRRGKRRMDELDSLIARLESVNDHAFAFPKAELKRLFGRAEQALRERDSQTWKLLRAIPFTRRTLWPEEETVRLRVLRSSIRGDLDDLAAARTAILDPDSPLSEGDRTELSLELIASVGGQEEQILRHFEMYKELAARSLMTLAAWHPPALRELARQRGESLMRLRSKANALRKRTGLQLKGDVTRARRAQNRFAKELRKLGLAA